MEKTSTCASLEDAIVEYRKRHFMDKVPVNSFQRVEKHRPIESYPEWCYRNEHPLKTGRKRKLYHRSDVVTPIIDAMTDMLDVKAEDLFGISFLIKRAKRKQRVEMDENTRLVSSSQSAMACTSCGDATPVSALEKTKEGLVCRCGLVRAVVRVSSSRQKLGASEEEDKTRVADAPTSESKSASVKYDRPPMTNAEAKEERMKKGAAMTSIGGGGGGGKRLAGSLGRICDAKAACAAFVAKEVAQQEFDAGVALLPRDAIRQRNILRALEGHFNLLDLNVHGIKRRVRMKLDKIYIRSVHHSLHCANNAGQCVGRICTKTPPVIALAVLNYELARIVQLVDDLESEESQETAMTTGRYDCLQGIDASVARETYSRLMRCTALQHAIPNGQLVTAMQVVRVLDDESFDYKKECAECAYQEEEGHVKNNVVQASSSSLSSLPSLPTSLPSISSIPTTMTLVHRTTSLVSNGTDSPVQRREIELRNAVLTIFSAFRIDATTLVRDAALTIVASDRFAENNDDDEKESTSSTAQASKKAFVLLTSLMQMKACSAGNDVLGSRQQHGSINTSICQRLGMSVEEATEKVASMKKFLETKCNDLVTESLSVNEECLFSLYD